MSCELYLGNSLEIMPSLPSKSIDLILTDPPYNVSVPNMKITRGKGKFIKGADIKLDFGDWDRGQVRWTDFVPLFSRLLTDNGVLVLFYEKLMLGVIGLYLQKKGWQVRHIGSWVKSNPAPQARKVKWQNGTESFLVATKNKGAGHHFNYRLGQSPDYFIQSINVYPRLHPTQKPVEVIRWIVNYWSFEGDTILDPFMGSGTTGVSALRLGRKFIGVESDPGYFSIAEKRIRQEEAQIKLF